MQIGIGRGGMVAAAAMAGSMLLAGCCCNRNYVETRTEVDLPGGACAPRCATSCPTGTPTTITVIRRTGEACPTLPPVGEITVVRSPCVRTKMVFVSVRPVDDRCFNVETRNFERPWPWGAYGTGDCQY